MSLILDRKKDIIKSVSSLDISHTLYKNAVEKYESIAQYLQSKGVECNIYPQGSFAIGTIVKPYNKNNDASYDLDVVCEITKNKSTCTPKDIKNVVGDILRNSNKYNIDDEYPICWTIKFADINDVEFSIDVVPAVDEDDNTKCRLISKSNENTELIKQSIAITKKNESSYMWATNNPKGYKEWFESINEKFKNYNRYERRMMLFEQHASVYNSVEDIPTDLERSSLQIVIQILKRHRDVYFVDGNFEDGLKPISAIITTIAATIAKNARNDLDPFELLEYICNELAIYSNLQTMNEAKFIQQYSNRNLIVKNNDNWVLMNPVNPEDNLLDSWNEKNSRASEVFFRWLNIIIKDYKDLLQVISNKEYEVILEHALGCFATTKVHNEYLPNTQRTDIIMPSKPWRK